MKIAVTAKGTDMNAAVDPRFGRAAYILIVDTETQEIEVLDNADNVQAFKGAGIQAAASVCDKGADVLLTGFCGPNAYKTLSAAGVQVANDAAGTVAEAIKAYQDGKLSPADGANVEGHW